MDKDIDVKEESKDPMYLCANCGRKFNSIESHSKHYEACEKVFMSKRQPFDSKKQRMEENVFMQINQKNDKMSPSLQKLMKAINKWKMACGMDDKITNKTQKLFKELFIEINPQQCSNCKRFFNENSYQKHCRNCHKISDKRTPFDSRKQRILNLEHAILLRRQEMLGKKQELINMNNNLKREKSRFRWRKLSDRFRTIMRISRLLYNAKLIK